ncbi:K(+)-stimulated pyrophosphate-energized sodium pump [Tenacibaculum mesophilum]|uniref:Putative K(+)-stimulated pyrophosphate-energized sodium pump n=1 Tax=Tenacibaculum mesophilum TaxID=104268 RepID=A0ABM7CFY4_9FLAO|nr:sodium-translocating pyrophosphatase [Tenacibaculum mesophilum]AZJ32719.1 sodium-translocating pyrophosphatase [Tenacibaculum mesophilum]QFS27970.1 sodium-translocating pyrophosphatase [Tenacibaculum mesophilum]SHF75832.1 K(+)-stimulated pyrophosphate-energized sodium pump [Tenacibaculum mesophilum]
MKQNMIYVPILLAILGLVFMYIKMVWVKKQDAGNDKMKSISKSIKEGALAFLAAEYRLLLIFVIIASLALFGISQLVETTSIMIVPAFIIGAIFSALAGNIGMRIATDANARTAEAAKTSLPQALKVSFGGGTVMGLGVAGLAVLGLSLFFLIFVGQFITDGGNFYNEMTVVLEALAGFSLGAESIALFARVGGGIYTKAADVGADLVGKVEAGIPEDDPRNPATIADNVGDNVGDVAGMGADLFGSYVATVLAAMVLGNYVIRDMSITSPFSDAFNGMGPILLPLVIAGVGIIASIIGTFLVGIKDNSAKEAQVQKALDTGNWVAIILTLIASFFLIKWMLPQTMQMKFFGEGFKEVAAINVFWAACIGLAVGALISMVTAYYTSLGKKPVLAIVQNSATGAGTNIIAGLAVGMKSTFLSVLLFAAAIYGSYYFAGFYGVALAASAMMATTAMQLAIDAFGPIADNAGGVAEMSELEDHVRERTDILDSVGNTTAAVGKGFAIASAALTALALFAAYVTFTGIDGINIFKADVLAMLFVGGMIPVIFSALAMQSVGKAAMEMVHEVRRQFREIPGIMEGTGTPEYAKCVDISTKAALKEMILPGLITIITPIIIGLVFGAEPLGGYMAGVCVSGVMWAIFQNNAGGAWDNAKKSFEAGVEINGEMIYKGSDAHKAAVTGDTVGDPFKDTSGPSMNILIKLTCLVGLVIAPILGGHTSSETHEETENIKVWIDKNGEKHEIKLSTDTEFTTENKLENIVKVNIEKNDDGTAKAIISTTIVKNGEETTEEKTFEGTLEEVEQKIKEYENSKKE